MIRRLRQFQYGRLVTPLAILAVTSAVVFMPAERSGWDAEGTIRFLAFFATSVAIYAVLAIGLNVQWGYTGIFNFGVMGFFLVGAYTAALIATPPAGGADEYIAGFGDRLDIVPALATDQWFPFLVGTLAAALFAGILAFFLSIPALRLREDYLAITTIGIAELLRRITIEERGLVNGTRALKGIPRPLGDLVSPRDYDFVILAIAIVVLILVYLVVERGIRSPWGRVLRALREDEIATAASGKNVFAFKAQGFVLGAMIMGIGGAIFAFANSAISPNTFSHFFGTFIFWAMIIVGGSGNNRGAIAGAYVVWGLWVITLQLQGYDLPTALKSRIPYLRELIMGVLIVVVLLLRPRGLLPEERRVSIWVERQTARRRRAEEEAQPP